MALHFISTGIEPEYFAHLLLCYLRSWGLDPKLIDNTDLWASIQDLPDQLVTSGIEAVILMSNDSNVLSWLTERPKVDFYWYQCLSPDLNKISSTIDRQEKILALNGKFLHLLSAVMFPDRVLPSSIYLPVPSSLYDPIVQISSWSVHPRVRRDLFKKLEELFRQLHQIHGVRVKRSTVQFESLPDPIERLLTATDASLDSPYS